MKGWLLLGKLISKYTLCVWCWIGSLWLAKHGCGVWQTNILQRNMDVSKKWFPKKGSLFSQWFSFSCIWYCSKTSCTTWGVKKPVNNEINYLSTGAGFLPSTVVLQESWVMIEPPSWMIWKHNRFLFIMSPTNRFFLKTNGWNKHDTILEANMFFDFFISFWSKKICPLHKLIKCLMITLQTVMYTWQRGRYKSHRNLNDWTPGREAWRKYISRFKAFSFCPPIEKVYMLVKLDHLHKKQGKHENIIDTTTLIISWFSTDLYNLHCSWEI